MPPARSGASGQGSRRPGSSRAVSGSQSSGEVTIVRAGISSRQPGSRNGGPTTQWWPQTKWASSADSLRTSSSTTSVASPSTSRSTALEEERRPGSPVREPHARLAAPGFEHLVLPRQRGDLTVERDPPAAIDALFVDAREQLLPAARVVPHERVVAAAGQGRRSGRPKPPRRFEEDAGPRAEVDDLMDLGSLVRKHDHPELVVLEDDAPPAAHRPRRDAAAYPSAGIDSRMYQLAVSPQSTVRSMPVIADASSEARNAHAAAISSGRTRRRRGTRSKRFTR